MRFLLKLFLFLLLSLFIFSTSDYLLFVYSLNGNFDYAFRLFLEYTPFRGIILFLFTLLGIISRDILLELKTHNKKDRIHLKVLINNTLHSKSFYESILYSPIIFMFFYLIAKDQPDIDLMTTLLFAFQNGFFWKTIMS